ncbi:MAG: hypothetical protein MMC33_002990 [Icmadophila ericetorum]|nr:hypothetical protein [Icmadophila ericetorum]
MSSTSPTPTNTAVYQLEKNTKELVIKLAPYTPPKANELVVKNGAVAINPLDWSLQFIGNMAFTWLKYPIVLGADLAGEIVEVGPGVKTFKVGDRVLAHAVGLEESRNRAAEGAFQEYTVLRTNMTSLIPDSLPYEEACVIPLGCSTAACGLFQKDFLGLNYPTVPPKPTGETLIVWGGSSSVGSNAIQLAAAAGYHVFTTCSPKNFEYVRRIGASQAFDYRSKTIVQDIVQALKGKTCAGAFALGNGSVQACVDIVGKSKGKKFVAFANYPSPEVPPQGALSTSEQISFISSFLRFNTSVWLKSKTKGVGAKFIWGGALQDNELGGIIYNEFLPKALAEGKYIAAPEPYVVGKGLKCIQDAVEVQKKGVSAKKVVVSL